MFFSMATLWMVGQYLEPLWGTREYVKFVLLMNVWGAVGTWTASVLLYSLGLAGWSIIDPWRPYGGFGGVIAAFAVVGKQLIPEYELPIAFLIPCRVKHFPLLLLCSSIFSTLLDLPRTSFFFIFFDTIAAWSYLRYYQKRIISVAAEQSADASSASMDETVSGTSPQAPIQKTVFGDKSDATAPVTFFPDALQPFAQKVFFCFGPSSNMPNILPLHIGDFSVLAHPAPQSPPSAILSTSFQGSTPSAAVPDLERERKRLAALQQVDARIAKMKASRASPAATEGSTM